MKDLKQLIRESINEYIRGIDEAGENAALEAKMNKTQEAIELREKKMNMDGLDEAYHDMLDKGKMKELGSEVKALKKSLAKYEKQLAKLKSKGEKSEKVEDVEEKKIVDEGSLGGNEIYDSLVDAVDDYYDPNSPENEKLMNAVEKAFNDGEIDTMDFSHSPGAPSEAVRRIAKEMGMGESLNESFLYMQKLAGVITEAQYQVKKK